MPKAHIAGGMADEELGGVQSVDTAVKVLSALADVRGPLTLKSVAERAGMHPSKAHRYLVSFCRNGLAERDPASGGYGLGPLAIRVGLTALRHLNVMQVGSATLVQLRDELGFSAGLAIWGPSGPTYVRFEESNDALIVSGRPGSVMPLLTSSAGRLFGAFLSRQITQSLMDKELAGLPHPGAIAQVRPNLADVERMFQEIRQAGLSWVRGDVNPGLHALSAPVFDHMGTMVGALSSMGPPGLFDSGLAGRNATVLTARAQEVSRRMGWAPG